MGFCQLTHSHPAWGISKAGSTEFVIFIVTLLLFLTEKASGQQPGQVKETWRLVY
jgi:hypothetical protein